GRAAANVPLRQLLGVGGGRRAVDIQKTIWIAAPVEAVYAFWALFENFPHFMSRVLEVRVSERAAGLSHWRVAGPAGVPVEFDAEVTRAIPNQVLAWRTLPGAPVAHAGIVHFEPEADGTRVQVRMSYNPPAGWIGHGVASLFGVDPKRSMDEDLVRMKTLIETGTPPRDAAKPV
ncbi:MAG TPA: SRPBCC family protein, partial [Vicinamibacterales bacterium]|nr:SRPBCC family protein [Vicinamibacterales bacterium]